MIFCSWIFWQRGYLMGSRSAMLKNAPLQHPINMMILHLLKPYLEERFVAVRFLLIKKPYAVPQNPPIMCMRLATLSFIKRME